MEDLIVGQINVDEDATDEEVEEDAVISSSDEEIKKDTIIFDSDEDNNDSEDNESESSYYEEVQENLSTKSKDDKLKNENKSKESLIKGKTSIKGFTRVINEIKTDKNHRGLDKAQVYEDDTHDEQKTNIVSSNTNDEDEYIHDSSDEEDIRHTIGNVPIKWYDEYDHLGYDWEGKKIPKPEKGDELDNFLKRMEDPDFWRTIKDPQTNQDVVLSEADIDLIVRIQKQKIPDVQFDEYAVSYS